MVHGENWMTENSHLDRNQLKKMQNCTVNRKAVSLMRTGQDFLRLLALPQWNTSVLTFANVTPEIMCVLVILWE